MSKFSPNKIKGESHPSSGNASSKMRGPQNGDSTGDVYRVKLELELREVWLLIGRSMDTPLYMSLYDWVMITR